MKKMILNVPEGIQYISEWKDYELPGGHCVVDKGVTGCGYTEYCLMNDKNVILCSPRKMLLENKKAQHKKDHNILYLENTIKDFEGLVTWGEDIARHMEYCRNNCLPVKFMVTYDSLHHILSILKERGIQEQFYYVVDEFQSIFLDAYFKASTEFDFVETLQDVSNVIYLSATPMLEDYLEEVPEFKDLDFYEIDWSGSGFIERINIKRVFAASLSGACGKIIKNYREGKFKIKLDKDGNLVESKEAVFYFNSISDILKIINKNKLLPSEVNVLCADTPENHTKLRRAYRGAKPKRNDPRHDIGSIPLKGEPNKMFTFCTRAVYIGADFYSDNASTFVFADPNINSLALDISLDLPQIAGRQRNTNNIFKNDITLYYRLIQKKNKITEDDFKRVRAKRQKLTYHALSLFDKGNEGEKEVFLYKLRDGIIVSKYSGDYVGISSKSNLPVYNNFIDLADRRAWQVSQKDYQDSINVTRSLLDSGFNLSILEKPVSKETVNFIMEFNKLSFFKDRLKLYCEYMDKNLEESRLVSSYISDNFEDRFDVYYSYYGSKGCSAREYLRKNLEEGLKSTINKHNLEDSVLEKYFEVGKFYSNKYVKASLTEIYKDNNIQKVATAGDISDFYEVKQVKAFDKTLNKRTMGYQIISRKH